MLIIKGADSSLAVDWGSVESIGFDSSELPNHNLRITTRSGGAISILNPISEVGSDLLFEDIVKAKLDNYTCWTISESDLR